jgi:hypothetical protein
VIHLTEDRYCEQAPGGEPLDDSAVKAGVPEHVTDDDIAWRPIRESAVEIQHVEPAAVADSIALCQVASEANRHGRNVDSVNREPSRCEPDGRQATSACEIDGLSGMWEQMLVRGEHTRRTRSVIGGESFLGVLLVPVQAIILGHSANLEVDPVPLLSGDLPTTPYRRTRR